jgi:large subunit ribosomal protein L14e
VTPLPEVGQLVFSRAGRDAGRPFVVVGVCDQRHVLVADGDLRPLARPKRKNVRHLAMAGARHAAVASGRVPPDPELRVWIRAAAGLGDPGRATPGVNGPEGDGG